MAMACIQNGSKHSPPQLGPGVVKVVVIGEPEVGKTKLIRGYYDHHEPGEIYSYNAVRVYPCGFAFDGMYKRAAIFEIPGDPASFEEQRMSHYEDAEVIVLMYAIDNPSSFELLIDKWLPEAMDTIRQQEIPVILVGNKKDLRDNDEVIERLHMDGKEPVTKEQGKDLFACGEILVFNEISAKDLKAVNNTFKIIFQFAVDGIYSD